MDVGLKAQTELSQKGEEIFSKISEELQNLKGNDKTLYLMASGIQLSVTEEHITIALILRLENSDQKEEQHPIGIISNPFEDRIIAKEGLCCYLVNNPEYFLKMEEDVSDDIHHFSRRYHFSLIRYWF